METLELYDWQLADVQKLYEFGLGLIGSEMGTGKTLEAIKLMDGWALGLHPSKPIDLIVAPLNTHDGWEDKFDRMRSAADVFRIDRKNRDAFSDALRRRTHDVYLMHWDAARLLEKQLWTTPFNTIIADEAHRMANRKNLWTRSIKRIPASHKVPMSGTLTGDRPQGLWSPLNWCFPKDSRFSSYWRFHNTYVEDEIVYPQGYKKMIGLKNIEQLHDILRPFYVRHLKTEPCCPAHPRGAMPWLGEKMYDTIWVELPPKQRRVYEEMRKHMVAWVGEHEDSPLQANIAAVQMLRLSQMCLATPRIESATRTNRKTGEVEEYDSVELELPSVKGDAIIEKLQDNTDQKFVVASSSKRFCYLFRDMMAKKGINSTMMSGDTPDSERLGQAMRFAHDDNQVYLGVIAAMNEGIDGLQHATSTMIFADRDWSSYKNKQCEDRLHRDGQKGKVLIIDVMAHNTVDLGRHQKLALKWQWIKALLDGKVSQTEEVEDGELA